MQSRAIPLFLLACTVTGSGCLNYFPARDAQPSSDGDAEADEDAARDAEIDGEDDADQQEAGTDSATPCTTDAQCDDQDPCTADRCFESLCESSPAPLDDDEDGHAASLCGGDDCDDGDPSIHPEADERCNGLDDDCDGSCDDGFDCCLGEVRGCETSCGSDGVATCSELCQWACQPPLEDVCNGVDDNCDGTVDEVNPILITSIGSMDPSLAWDGEEFGLAWSQSGTPAEVRFARFPRDPRGHTSVVRIGEGGMPSLVWADGEYAVAYRHPHSGDTRYQGLFVSRFDTSGRRLGGEVDITSDAAEAGRSMSNPALVWTGASYGLAWCDTNPHSGSALARFLRLTVEGQPLGEVDTPGASEVGMEIQLVWTGSELGMAWNEVGPQPTRIIGFTRFTAAGTRREVTRLTTEEDGSTAGLALSWIEREFSLAFTIDGAVQITRVSSAGDEIGDQVELTDGRLPSLAWTGEVLGMAFVSGTPGDVFFAAVNPTERRIIALVRITSDDLSSSNPSLIWTGQDFGVAWQDVTGRTPRISFASFVCTL